MNQFGKLRICEERSVLRLQLKLNCSDHFTATDRWGTLVTAKGAPMNEAYTQEKASDELKSLTERISHAIQHGKFTAAELQAALARRSRKIAQTTDDLVHDFAWTAVGMGVGLGFLMGMLAARSTQPLREAQPRREKPFQSGAQGRSA